MSTGNVDQVYCVDASGGCGYMCQGQVGICCCYVGRCIYQRPQKQDTWNVPPGTWVVPMPGDVPPKVDNVCISNAAPTCEGGCKEWCELGPKSEHRAKGFTQVCGKCGVLR